MTIYDVAEIVGQAYPRAFTPVNIQAGFRASEIWPVNENIFWEDEFLSASVTNRILPTVSVQDMNKPTESLTNDPQNKLVQDIAYPRPSTSAGPSGVITFVFQEWIRPFPKATARVGSSRGRRKPGRSRVLTETPEKAEIEEAYEEEAVEKDRNTESH